MSADTPPQLADADGSPSATRTVAAACSPAVVVAGGGGGGGGGTPL